MLTNLNKLTRKYQSYSKSTKTIHSNKILGICHNPNYYSNTGGESYLTVEMVDLPSDAKEAMEKGTFCSRRFRTLVACKYAKVKRLKCLLSRF